MNHATDDAPGSRTPAVALTIAGSDSGGGAGIQADLKTFHAFGVFGTSAITAVTAQDTRGVSGVQMIDPDLVDAQIRAVAEDLRPGACKTGMLGNGAIVEAVAGAVRDLGLPGFVLDPVMVAQSGDRLLADDAVATLRDELIPLADLVTPNLTETGLLVGRAVEDEAGMRRAAEEIRELGAGAVLVKGGHMEGDQVLDLLLDDHGWSEWRASRIRTRAGHGTGCTLSAAAAAGLSLGRGLREAVDAAVRFTRHALQTAPDLGRGSAPLNHWAPVSGR
jgi:hydroxymethylpyrimidine/phosphomethylpyrimidine kinase